jgi:hypothetical protein
MPDTTARTPGFEVVVTPEKFAVGDRIYELVSFYRADDPTVNGWVTLDNQAAFNRGRLLGASMGREDGEYIRDHQNDLPPEYREQVTMVFPGWLVLFDDLRACAWYFRWYYRLRHWLGLGDSPHAIQCPTILCGSEMYGWCVSLKLPECNLWGAGDYMVRRRIS